LTANGEPFLVLQQFASCSILLIYLGLDCEVALETAKVFWSGRSQAIRLPKEFRFDTDEVRIRRHGEMLILEPLSHDWSWLESIVGPVDDDFVAATEEQPSSQSGPELDFFE
jgi:antitoxin VapB